MKTAIEKQQSKMQKEAQREGFDPKNFAYFVPTEYAKEKGYLDFFCSLTNYNKEMERMKASELDEFYYSGYYENDNHYDNSGYSLI